MPAFADVLDETELKALTDSLAARREKVKRAAKTSPSPRSE
jgi:hypothetical protein